MLRRIVPPDISAPAQRKGRLGFAVSRRTFLLLLAGLVLMAPAFSDGRALWAMLAWDVAVLGAWALDLVRLPRPRELEVRCSWSGHLMLGEPVTLRVTVASPARVDVDAIVDLPPELSPQPVSVGLQVPARGESEAEVELTPRQRGDVEVGPVYLRYRSPLALAERSLNLMRTRRIEVQKRLARRKGIGREFESLRDYRHGDSFRDISWTATARRGKLIVKDYQVERGQPVWIVLDCGRLMRGRIRGRSKLDYAASAALNLAHVASYGGDRVGLLAYGHDQKRMVSPGRGDQHMRAIMDQLALAEEEPAESAHLRAAGTLMAAQSRRALVVWITDLADTAMVPEVIEGASVLLDRHLLIFAVIDDPELRRAAASQPHHQDDLFRSAAAVEVMHRRERQIATLRGRGAHTLEVGGEGLSARVIEQYLSLKERDLL
jgi:uncharacterized protein (DUF58 family)